MTFASDIFGDFNNVFQNSNGNIVNFGNIIFDKAKRAMMLQCPDCKQEAKEEDREGESTYSAFICKCGRRFFEHDDLDNLAGVYLNLDAEKGNELRLVIEAVNHDLQAYDIHRAYERCQRNLEKFSRTPQIFEWHALTRFLSLPVDVWIRGSMHPVLTDLRKAQTLDKKSSTYPSIAASIATRYYTGILRHLDAAKKHMPAVPVIDKKTMTKEQQAAMLAEYTEKSDSIKKELFRCIKQFKFCYDIYEDTDFIKTAILELYGYGGVSWFDLKFKSIFIKPDSDPSHLWINGNIMDFHYLVESSGDLFANSQVTPLSLLRELEEDLSMHETLSSLPQMMVAKSGMKPATIRKALALFQVQVLGCAAISLVILYLLGFIIPLVGVVCLIGVLVYFNRESQPAV
jgi:hypothetical protein